MHYFEHDGVLYLATPQQQKDDEFFDKIEEMRSEFE